jgi:hypothetical protein
MLSLTSFDMKSACNSVYQDTLLQGLRARGIPESFSQMD